MEKGHSSFQVEADTEARGIVDDDRCGRDRTAAARNNRASVASRHVVDTEVESSRGGHRMIVRVGHSHSQSGIRRRDCTSLIRYQDRGI